MYLSTVTASLLALASISFAASVDRVEARTCRKGSHRRKCWDYGFEVGCDTDKQWPRTGKTKTYHFEITEQNYAPDGHERPMMLVNGQFPGPLIEADWGDTISVTVVNSLKNNGTSIHWHGMRQYKTNTQDGTNGLTECPIAPGGTKTYTFLASAYGTSWYHSHHSMQYANGIVGPMLIHGPTTADWDVELKEPITLTDWFYTPADPLYMQAEVAPGPPTADNILIGGKMTSSEGGEYYTAKLKKGKRNLVHFVNVGINNYMHIALDGHKFQVVGADFVPIKPFTTDSLVLAVGQRYDVIIDADQKVDNYWLRVGTGSAATGPAQGICDGPNKAAGNARAIFSYHGAPNSNPTEPTNAISLPTGCYDQPSITPYIKTTVPSGLPKEYEINFQPASSDGQVVTWLVNNSAININWEYPTLQYVIDGRSEFPADDNVVEVNVGPNEWTYWVLHQDPDNLAKIPHPIHLHGHDFYVLSQGEEMFDGTLNLENPVRRDTATLPGTGHLVLAFRADNPGAWLMHCHIPFHISGGLGLQFLERRDEILDTVGGLDDFNSQCQAWYSYRKGSNSTMYDSGLKARGLPRPNMAQLHR